MLRLISVKHGQVLYKGKESKAKCFQANLLESKTIFFSERKMNCVLSHRIFLEEEDKGKGCNLIG